MNYSGERFIPNECSGEIAVEHYQRYQFAKQLVGGKIVLDAACGEGYGSSIVSETASQVYGLDISQETVELANKKYGGPRLSYVQGTIAELPFDDHSIDIVLSFETIEHISEDLQIRFLNEIKRVLKTDGLLVMSTPNKAVYTDLVQAQNEFHLKEFYLQEFTEFLERYFQKIKFYFQYPDTAYFFAEECKQGTLKYCGIKGEESRYFIAICSNYDFNNTIKTEDLIKFDNSMYYFLNKLTHKQEQALENMKNEADVFQEKQERSIVSQKEYIEHLENDMSQQKEYAEHLENDILQQKEYIEHLENDMSQQKGYIIHLEQDLSVQTEYAGHLENDIVSQKEYVVHLEKDIAEQNASIMHLQNDIIEQKEYIAHLEKDISEQRDYIIELEQKVRKGIKYIFERRKK